MDNNRKVYVLDTNIILLDSNNIFKLADNGRNLIVIPETVLDEVDSKKDIENGEIGVEARHFTAKLKDRKKIGEVTIPVNKNSDKEESLLVSKYLLDGIEIHFIEKSRYHVRDATRNILNDRKIIEVAVAVNNIYTNQEKGSKDFLNLKHKYQKVIFVTMDGMCSIRAESRGLLTEALHYDNKDTSEPEFIKVLKTNRVKLDGMKIETVSKDHLPENYCYIFQRGEKKIYALIKNGLISVIDLTMFNKLPIKPRNDEQILAYAAMLDPDFEMILIDALAGSGKTLLALAAGIKDMERYGNYDKIIYIRNSVDSTEKAEEVGALSGNKEKFEVYNLPLYDTIEVFIDLKRKPAKKVNPGRGGRKAKNQPEDTKKEEEVEKFMSRYKIQTMWTGSIRGRTIRNAYVIIDEAQNFSRKSLKRTLTRMDDTCKIIIIGSNRQIDHPFESKYTNGLSRLLQKAKEPNNYFTFFASSLIKAERGRITAWSEDALD